MPVSISADEKRWRAESDARTLAEAETIKQDETRLTEAQTAAKRMADEEAERLKAMRKVAGSKAPSSQGRGMQKQATGSTKKKTTGSSGDTNKHKVFERI